MKAQVDPNNFDENPDYNDWLDDRYASDKDSLDIFGFKPRPSYVLHQLSFATYQTTISDYLSEREEQLRDLIISTFPTPIAYYFYRFEYGYESELQRLFFLRDTWEAIVDVIHAVAVSECRHNGIHLNEPVRFHHFLTDSVDQRLLTIGEILSQAHNSGSNLEIESIANMSVLAKIRELNQRRNAFSHSAAQSEKQAREWTAECYGDMIGVLSTLRGLAQIKFARYLAHSDASTLRCEIFQGHHLTRTIEAIVISDEQALASASCFRRERLFVTLNGHLFILEPLFHFLEDESGHLTSLLVFRKAYGTPPDRTLEFAIVGKALPTTVNRGDFSVEINGLRSLVGIQPE